MAPSAPAIPGIVAFNKDAFLRDLSGIRRIDVDDAFKIWRVQTTGKKAMANEGRRCENLFWRILGGLGGEPVKHISGRNIAPILRMIFNGEDAVVDMQRRIPTKLQMAQGFGIPPTPPPSPLPGSKMPSPAAMENELYEQNQPSQTALSAMLLYTLPDTPASPPQIFVPPPSPATPRPNLPRSNQSYPMDNATGVGMSIKSSQQRESSRGQRKHTTFASNTKSGATSKKSRPKPKRNGSSSATKALNQPLSNNADGSKGSVDTNTSSIQSTTPPPVESPLPMSDISEATLARERGPNDWVVAPDFRSRFQEQRRKSQLSPEEELLEQKLPAVSSRVKITTVDSIVPLKAGHDVLPPVERFSESTLEALSVFDGKPSVPILPLQRTKSQLSMLFAGIKDDDDPEDQTIQSGQSSAKGAPAPPVVDEMDVNKESKDDGFEDDDEDDDVLEMPISKPRVESRPKLKAKKSTSGKGKERARRA